MYPVLHKDSQKVNFLNVPSCPAMTSKQPAQQWKDALEFLLVEVISRTEKLAPRVPFSTTIPENIWVMVVFPVPANLLSQMMCLS